MNSNFIEISKEKLPDTVKVPTSKSYSNRLLILGALKKTPFKIKHISSSSDTQTLIECLEKIGIDIIREGDEVNLLNSFPACEVNNDKEVILETKEGGTTNRFLLGLLSKGKKRYRLVPTKRMLERINDSEIKELEKLNIMIKKGIDSLTIQGPGYVSEREVICQGTTQIASGILMSYQNEALCPKEIFASKAYLSLTQKLIEEAEKNNEITIPLDASSLSYPLALGLKISEQVKRDPLQADDAIWDYLENFPFEIEGSKHIDLIPTLVFMASYRKGRTIFSGINGLRAKESDRLSELKKILNLFEIDFVCTDDCLSLCGAKEISHKVDYHCPDDHRMAMVAALFMLKNNGGRIFNYDCVKKSYPDFFEQFGQK